VLISPAAIESDELAGFSYKSSKMKAIPSVVVIAAFAAIHCQAAVSYSTILANNQSITGVRGYDNTSVILTGSAQSGGVTVGMWWLGSLQSGAGTTYTPTPNFSGQTVTTSIFYSANTAMFDPSLGSNIFITGSYQYSESSVLNHGFLYRGPLDGSGTWRQIDVPSSAVGGATVEDTIPHSVMGDLVVGNYDLQGVPASGNAFIYRISTDTWTVMAIDGSTANLTSAYGIWQNGPDSYTIVGGSKHGGVNKAFLVDYQPSTGLFTHLTFFDYQQVAGLTHFEGITGVSGGYNVVGGVTSGAVYAFIARKSDGSFAKPVWTPIVYPGSSVTTGDTVYQDIAMGIYQVSGVSGVRSYTANVDPHPGVAVSVSKSGNNATFTITNTGDTTNEFTLSDITKVSGSSGPKPPKPVTPPYKITFKLGGEDVTNDVKAGTASTGELVPGASVKLSEKVTIRRPLVRKRTIHTTLQAALDGDSSTSDSAKVKFVLQPQ
jgi:hypothetical protein